MSFAHTFVGQYIKPVPIFSTFGTSRISRCLSSKRFKPRSLRYGVANSLQSSQWKIDLIGRSTQWSLARHAAWLLFGFCSLAGGVNKRLVPPAMAEPVIQCDEFAHGKSPPVLPVSALHQQGKRAITDYSVIGIPGDGRCLFRAVVHGAQIRKGKSAPNERTQREYADELREQVVDELVKRRAETEWYIISFSIGLSKVILIAIQSE